MRTLTLLTLLALTPLLGIGQSVSISAAFDSTQNQCKEVGENVYYYCYGQATNMAVGDTIDLYADYGNGPVLEASVPLDSGLYFWGNWYHSFSVQGTKNVEFTAVGPNGNSDTAYHTTIINDSCATIQGTAYVDENGNCSYDSGEPLLDYKDVKLLDNNNNLMGYSYTNNSGQYQFQVAPNQTYNVVFEDTANYNMTCPSSGVKQVSNFPAYGVDFGVTCKMTSDFFVNYAYSWGFRPGFVSNINFDLGGTIECSSDSISCVKVVLNNQLSAHDSLMDSVSTPGFDVISGDTVIWDLTDSTDIDDFSWADLPVYVDTNATIGDTICIDIMICAAGDADPSNNTYQFCDAVVNSWDPNNKRVMPRGQGQANYISANQRMTYTINFQNTGTAPAIDVRLEDTLRSAELDPASIQVMASSHQISKVDVKNNNIIKFHFNNIMLPDSGTSQHRSKGFVRFSIDQEPNLSDGTVIENSAAIFFDQNPAVITNTAMNTIGTVSIEEADESVGINIYPNPARTRLNIALEEHTQGIVTLRNMVGKEVANESFQGTRTALDVNELPGGVYILSVRADSRKDAIRKKVVIR